MENPPLDTFGKRLRFAMIQAGFKNTRTPTNVSIHKLSEITQNSPQICRKYLRSEVSPSHQTTIKIAKHLNVTPGWLLFGENSYGKDNEHFYVSKTLLQYIFDKSVSTSALFSSSADFATFLLTMTTKVCELGLSDEQSIQIIDLMLSSARSFKK
ncbi:MAG: helix-turn-helix domain-containing protein [Gammaproteobacteria bacterium]|nr:helix-turn-helix domain-containing protein [Gammaproteobacteria bacterium]